MNALFKCQFEYCPLISMFYGYIDKNQTNKLRERCVRIIYCDKYLSNEELLKNDSYFRYITKTKVVKELSPET